jgi:hypothetical protein
VAITDAVRSRIPGAADLDGLTVQVYCDGGSPSFDFSGCDSPTPGTTRLNVRVSWRYHVISPAGAIFGNTPTVSSTAGMVYVGSRYVQDPPAPACNVVFGAPTGTVLAGSTLAENLTATFTTDAGEDCTGFTVRLVDGGGQSRGSGSVSYGAPSGTITFTPGQVSGLAPGSYSIQLTTASGSASVLPVTLTAGPVCAVQFNAPATGTEVIGGTLVSDLVVPFTGDGSPDCDGMAVRLLDEGGTVRGTGSIAYGGTAGTITFTPGQVSGVAAGAYTIELSTPGGGAFVFPVTLTGSAACTATVIVDPEEVGHNSNSGNLNQDLKVTVTPQNCSGQFTVELWLEGTPNTLYNSKPATASAPSTTMFPKNQTLNKLKFVSGTYVVRVNSAAVLVGSAEVEVS